LVYTVFYIDTTASAAPETRTMSVTPPRSSVETDSLRLTKIDCEDFVKQDFPVSDDRVGRFVFDASLRTVKLYVLDYYEDYTSDCPYLLLTAKDWTYFYNQIWREFNFGDKIRYIFQWDAVTQGMRYRVTTRTAYMCVTSCWDKTHHDQNYLMMTNKRREESEKSVLSESSDESDDETNSDSEYDRDFPIPEDNAFGCCKTNLYYDRSDVPLLNIIFSTIDQLFQSSEPK
jgi:hypothetical protein